MALSKEDLITAINELTDKEAKDVAKVLNVKINEANSDKAVKNAAEMNRLSNERLETLSKTSKVLNDMGQYREAELELEKRAMAERLKDMEGGADALKDFFEAVANGAEEAFQQMEGSSELLSMFSAEELKSIKEKIRYQKLLNDGQEKYGSDQRKIVNDFAKSVGLSEKYADTTLGKIYQGMETIAKGGEEAVSYAISFANEFGKAFNVKNIALNAFNFIYDNTMSVLKAFDTAQAAIAKTTGQGREFNDVLYESGRAGNLFGVSMDEAADAINTMVAQTSAFTNLNKDLQAEIALNVAQMSELGIATSDSAEIFQNFNQSLGITASESIKMQKELAMAGVEVGIGASKITKDFNASLSTLMVYGRESINVFKGIAAAAKAAGVETSTLLNIAQQYDTFAGAAEGVGKLNSLLGTQLSTTEMLMATEDERIRMLVESVQAQGVAFQDMDRFTQKAVANAAGITDMAEANKIFGMSLKEYDENEKKLKASADVQKKFEDAVAATVPVMEKFKLLGAEMITALQPTFEVISNIAEGLTDMLKGMTTTQKNWAVGITAGLAAVATLAPLFMVGGPFLAGLAAMPASIAASGAAAGGAAVGFGALAASLAPIFKGILAVAAIGGLAYGLGSMFSGGEDKAEGITGPEVDAIQNLDNIMNADFSSALSTIKAIVGEASKLGSDMKVTSTIENLAMITSGQAKDISGNIVTASTTNVVAKVNNMFDGMKVNLIVDGYQVEGVFAGMQDGNERG